MEQQKIFEVAHKSLQDCIDLLQCLHQYQPSSSAAVNGNSVHSSGETTPTANGAYGKTSSLTPPHPVCTISGSELYTKPSKLACDGTVGKHVRHIFDHFRLLMTTCPHPTSAPEHPDIVKAVHTKGDDLAGEWVVDYDQRSRLVPMESDIQVAIQELVKLQKGLEQYRLQIQRSSLLSSSEQQSRSSSSSTLSTLETKSLSLISPLTLNATIDSKHSPVPFQSTFGRELWFCSLHAVHHFAMMKVICGESGFEADLKDFGIAPSTVQSRQS